MMRYSDASAIVPLVVQESRTNDPRAALAEDSGIVTWWGKRIECTTAIARLERAAFLTPLQASQTIEVLRALASGWNGIKGASHQNWASWHLLQIWWLAPMARSGAALQSAWAHFGDQ